MAANDTASAASGDVQALIDKALDLSRELGHTTGQTLTIRRYRGEVSPTFYEAIVDGAGAPRRWRATGDTIEEAVRALGARLEQEIARGHEEDAACDLAFAGVRGAS